MDSKVEGWSVGWPKGWRACCEAGPGRGNSRCKDLRDLSVSEAQNRGCPFRLTQKMDTVGRRCHGVHLPSHLRENAKFLFPTYVFPGTTARRESEPAVQSLRTQPWISDPERCES